MYETNTLHGCYESVSTNVAKARHMQTIKRRSSSQFHPPVFQTNSIFIPDICKLIKTANKDWRNMLLPSGLDISEHCCGDGMSSPVALCLRSWLLWHFRVLPDAVMHPFPFISPQTTFPCPHNSGIMISPSVFIIYVWCTWLHLLACELITTQVMITWPLKKRLKKDLL